MKSYKQCAAAAATALVMACAGAGSASATTISPATVLSSANSSLTVSGGGQITCSNATISGTTPPGTAAVLTMNVTLAYTGCTAFFVFPATVTVPSPCAATGGNAVTLHVKYNSSTDIAALVTIPSGCTITASIPGDSCTLTFAGAQTIGNGSSGTGGISWSNGSSTVRSTATANTATIPSVASSGGGFGCPSAGAHTGTLGGSYQVTTPAAAPGVTVGP
jgi:hypothetical protein